MVRIMSYYYIQLSYLIMSYVPIILGKVIDYQSSGSDNHKHLPEGLMLFENFVSEEQEAELLQSISWDLDSVNNLKHRRVKHYGYAFIYETSNVNKQNPLPGGFPKPMELLMDKIVQSGIMRERPDQLTCNQYAPGQGIPPHVDTHSAFEDSIVSVSLGKDEFWPLSELFIPAYFMERIHVRDGLQASGWKTILHSTASKKLFANVRRSEVRTTAWLMNFLSILYV